VTPIDVEFSPALSLGSRAVVDAADLHRTLGDVHATGRARLVDVATISITGETGWSLVPPSMPPTVGARSSAPRIISERLGAASDAPYDVTMEGPAGHAYIFLLATPRAAAQGVLARVADGGVVSLGALRSDGAPRPVTITFPATGANADGYTRTIVSFTVEKP
jgi:hypothetical protein